MGCEATSRYPAASAHLDQDTAELFSGDRTAILCEKDGDERQGRPSMTG
jgi:hypothetical protein